MSLLLPGLAALFLAGCVMVPIGTNDDRVLSGRPVATNQLHQVTLGVSTTNEVSQVFGTPDAIWEEENTFIYWWVSRKAEVYWVLVSTAGMAGGSFDVGRNNIVFAKFDETGKLLSVAKTVRAGLESIGHHLIEWRDGTMPPDQKHSTSVAPKNTPKALVIFQLRATANGRPVEEATKNFWGQHDLIATRNFRTGVGTFGTGGIPIADTPRRLETPGWYGMVLAPGRYYLGIQPGLDLSGSPYSLGVDHGVLLRLDIPAGEPLIYAGTISPSCTVGQIGPNKNVVSWVNRDEVGIENRIEATQTLKEVLKRGQAPTVRLMKLHNGPYLLTEPKRIPKPS